MPDTVYLKGFNPNEVAITDPYLVNAYEKEIDYLFAYDPDRLLAGFYEVAGKSPAGERYPGWESAEIRGHTLGHYMSAIAQAYAREKEGDRKKKIYQILLKLTLGLKECQLESGYLSAFPEDAFDRIENRLRYWVPWYTAHKIMSGLIDAYKNAGIAEALEVAAKYGDWVYQRTSRWTPELQETVLRVEYGGMNDCMYELYKITKNEKHSQAAHMFDELSLFTPIQKGEDILKGRHANTTIPKFLGALNRYFALGEDERFYLEAAESFFDIVTNHHSYITGGNSDMERFGEPEELDARRSNCNCESCNTYNMLKLARGLFQITGNKKYADFYDNAFLNAIIACQHPETGMQMYFNPMATGYFKVYGTPFDKFWCCQGTGMESFTKLNDSLYFKRGEREIFVNGYYSSILTPLPGHVKLEQHSDFPHSDNALFTFFMPGGEEEFTLHFRVPFWAAGEPTMTWNGEAVPCETTGGYLRCAGIFKNGDQLRITFPLEVTACSLPDDPDSFAFRYGPAVLSAALGDQEMEESVTGVICSIATRNFYVKDYITVLDGKPAEWINNLADNLVKDEDTLAFRLKGTDEDDHLVFTPHYLQHKERYGIYWYIVPPDSAKLKAHLEEVKLQQELENATIDRLPLGNDQYELEHDFQGEKSESGTWNAFHFRKALKGGYFSYRMKVNSSEEAVLLTTFHRIHGGTRLSIFADDVEIADITLETPEAWRFYERKFTIPAAVTAGKGSVVVRFVPHDEGEFAIYGNLRTLKAVEPATPTDV